MTKSEDAAASPAGTGSDRDPAHSGEREPIAKRLTLGAILGLLLLAGIGIFVPIQTEPGIGFEYWWPVALSDAFLSGRQFGVDVIDTYGPWGFVIGGYHPKTLALATAIRGLIAIVAMLAVWDIGRRSSRKPWSAPLLVALTLVTAVICWSDFLVTLWTFVYLVRALELPERRTNSLGIALLVVSGVVALMKFSSFVAIGVIVAAVTADDLRRRERPVSLFVWTSAVAILWLAAGQGLATFASFVSWSLHLARSYTEAVGIDAVLYEPWSFTPFVASTVIFSLAAIFRRNRDGAAAMAIRLPAIWLSLFFLFKWGFVRADHFHIAPACGVLFLTQAMFTLVWLSDESTARRRWLAVPLAISLLVSLWLVHGFVRRSFATELEHAARQSASGVRQLVVWGDYERGLLANHAEAIAMLPPLDAAALGGGTADSYPAATGIVLQRNVRFAPRPVFRSYHTFTPNLANQNADHLRKAPPDVVVFGIQPIDRRYPSLEDGASWPFLLENYSVAREMRNAVVLRRRESVHDARLETVGRFEARLRERVTLPSGGRSPIYARIDIELTTAGRLLSFVYKPPELQIEARLADGSRKTKRIVREMVASEFLLSPYVETPEAFAMLASDDGETSLQRLEVRDFTISVKGSETAYVPAYEVTLLSPVTP